jgi:phage tail-like protein
MSSVGIRPASPYLVKIGETGQPEVVLGGFSEVSDLTGLHTTNDVALKRGVVNASSLRDWITQARSKGSGAHKRVSITLRDENSRPGKSWKLTNVAPVKYTGPSLAGEQGEIAIEELVLAAEAIEAVDSAGLN